MTNRPLTEDEDLTIRACALEYRSALRNRDPLTSARHQAAVLGSIVDDLKEAGEPFGAALLALLARVHERHTEAILVPADERRRVAAVQDDGGPSDLTVSEWLATFND